MDDELKKKLDPVAYRVTQEKGTEAPFSGEYNDFDEPGRYACKVCGAKLFGSDAKFASDSGWPAFDAAIPGAVRESPDDSFGMHRTALSCANCGAHLGHVFDGGMTKPMVGRHFCVNSCALDFDPADGAGK
jgi:peptide-methionine (R)-S-oxide reductase